MSGTTSRFTSRVDSWVLDARPFVSPSLLSSPVFTRMFCRRTREFSLRGPVDGVLQFEDQAVASHLENAQAGATGRQLQIVAHIPARVEDLPVFINDGCRGSVVREQAAIEFFLNLGVIPGCIDFRRNRDRIIFSLLRLATQRKRHGLACASWLSSKKSWTAGLRLRIDLLPRPNPPKFPAPSSLPVATHSEREKSLWSAEPARGRSARSGSR